MKIRLFFALCLLFCLAALFGCVLQTDPLAEFSAEPSSGYPPLDVHFDAGPSRSPNGPILSYDWDFDDGETDSGEEVDHTFADKGIYRVTLIVTDSEGKVGTRYKNVQALSLPPVALFDYWPRSPVKNYPVEFKATGSYDPDGEIVEYVWSFGDGESAWGEVVEHLFQTANRTYPVTLTVIDDDNVSNSTTKSVRVFGCEGCG